MSDPDDTAIDDDLEELAYGDAVAELESILAAIEDDAIDIDQLSRQVRRAAALIRLCQTRIAGARIEVEQVVADLSLGLERVPVDPDTADVPDPADADGDHGDDDG